MEREEPVAEGAGHNRPTLAIQGLLNRLEPEPCDGDFFAGRRRHGRPTGDDVKALDRNSAPGPGERAMRGIGEGDADIACATGHDGRYVRAGERLSVRVGAQGPAEAIAVHRTARRVPSGP